MKPFRFRLEALLTLRLRAEEMAGEALAYASARREKAAAAVTAGEQALEDLNRALMDRRSKRLDCGEHLLMLQAMEIQRRECLRLAHVLHQSEAEVTTKREDLALARREREVVDRLKERQRAEHAAEMQRREEAEISDLLGARHALQARGDF